MSSLIERSPTEKLWNIRGEIIDITQQLGINMREINYEESALIRSGLMTKFTGSNDWNFPWDHLNYPNIATYRDIQGEAYKLISDFMKNESAFILFNESDERAAFEFSQGIDIVRVLEECFRFEYYLTDKNFSYFICFNHHEYLVTAGVAANWLKNLLDENRELKKPIKEIISV